MTANLTSVGLANGAPTSGSGTVSTLDALMAQLAGQGLVAAASIAVADSATLLAAPRPGRLSIVLFNEGATPVRIGPAGVTWASGSLLPGDALALPTAAEVYAVTQSGSAQVSVLEVY